MGHNRYISITYTKISDSQLLERDIIVQNNFSYIFVTSILNRCFRHNKIINLFISRHPWSACDPGQCDRGGVLSLPNWLEHTQLHSHSRTSPDLQTSQGDHCSLYTHIQLPSSNTKSNTLYCIYIITLIFILPTNWSKRASIYSIWPNQRSEIQG